MKRNKAEACMLPGQITFWDMEITQKAEKITEKSVLYTKMEKKSPIINNTFTELSLPDTVCRNDKHSRPLELTDKQQEFINKNGYMKNENLSRVIKYCGGGVGIELQYENTYRSIYVNTEGKEEFTSERKIPVLPMDKILYYKSPKNVVNNTQEEKLKNLIQQYSSGKVIRRKGDESIIIELHDKVIAINAAGWILEYKDCKVIYLLDEVISMDPAEEIDIETMQNSVKLGDIIQAQCNDGFIEGKVVHVYGPGNVTINFIYDNGTKHGTTHRSRITKLIKCA